jgi:hypothetical protein
MILDKETLFSEDQAITGTAVSTNVVDLVASGNIGPGQPVQLQIQVTEDFDNLTDLTVDLETDDNEAFSSATTLLTSEAAPLADLKAGYRFNITYMPQTNEQYLRLNYKVNGSSPTQGKITAGVVEASQTNLT